MPAAIINQETPNMTFQKGEFSNTGLVKKHINARAGEMQNKLTEQIPTLRELSDYIYPTRGSFYTPKPNKGSKIDHVKLLDDHATLAVDIFVSGMLSGYSSKARPWYRLGLSDLDLMKYVPVKLWLDQSTNILQEIHQKSNVYQVLKSVYAEDVVFSTACMYLEEDFERVIRARNYTAGEYAISANSKGDIDGFHRKFYLTVGQLVHSFGIGNCSQLVQQAYKNNKPGEIKQVNHLIEANNDRIPFLKDYKNMPFRSAYWEASTDNDENYLRIGGYEEFPIIAPRWDTRICTNAFGEGGPGWKALGNVKMLQQMTTNKLIGLDKETDPPVQADASVVGEVNTLPGGVTRFSANLPNAGVKPTYQVALNLEALDQSISGVKDNIGRHFFTNLFLMILEAERIGREITATEILEKQAERVQALAPILESFDTGLSDPLIERTYNIAQRKGLIPPPPPEIADMELKIQYISVLAQAQKLIGVTAVDQFAQGVIADEAVSPGATDILNFDEKNRYKADVYGVPERILNAPEKIAQIRKNRADREEVAERQQNMVAGASAAKDTGKATKDLSEAEVGKGSALDSVLAGISNVRSDQAQ